VREAESEAEAHQGLPFEALLDALQVERDPSRHPVFQVVFEMDDAPPPLVELPGLGASPVALDGVASMFDLTLTLREEGAELVGDLQFNPDLFEDASMLRMLGHFQNPASKALPPTQRKRSTACPC